MRRLRWLTLASLFAAATTSAPSISGNLAVLEVLSVVGSSSTNNAVRLLQIAPNGTLVNVIRFPEATVGLLSQAPSSAKLLRSADSAFVSFAGYTASGYVVVSVDASGSVSVVDLTGYRGTPVLQSAFRNSDGSFYVCSATGSSSITAPLAAYVTPAGISSELLINRNPCNFLAPQGSSLLFSAPGSWALALMGSTGDLPKTSVPLAYIGQTGNGPEQSFSWVFDDTGTTIFSCVPFGLTGYGIWRNILVWSSTVIPALQPGSQTLLLHTGNISCFGITGQVEADGFAVYFTGGGARPNKAGAI